MLVVRSLIAYMKMKSSFAVNSPNPFRKTISPWFGGSESPLWHALLAVMVGAVGGLGAVGFRLLIGVFHNLSFFGSFSPHYDANIHTLASSWGAWVILAPIVGAVIVTWLVRTFAPEAKGHGVPEVMDAIHYNRGIIRPTVAAIKALASSLSIGTGGAVGREGPIIQIGSAFGSTLGQILPVPEWQRMTLIACGAAGGIAATFNTPIGGVLFAVELILPEISARTLVPTAIATGSATFISRLAFGDHPAFNIPALSIEGGSLTSMHALIVYSIFGVLLGLVSIVFIRMLYAFEDIFDALIGNDYVRHMTGMLLVGVIMYLMMRYTGHYYIEGVGYATVQDVLNNSLTLPLFLFGLLVLKLLAMSLTLGSGGSGGVFSPSLFMGATLGGAYAGLINTFFPMMHLDPASTAVIGMAGIVGGATGAVVTAIVMIFEMTRDYSVIIPLMISVSIAYGVRRVYLEASIYDLKLQRRGHYIPVALHNNLYLLHSAGQLISTPVLHVTADSSMERLRKILRRVKHAPHLLISNQDQVTHVVAADKVGQMDLSQGLETALEGTADENYIVVSSDDLVFDIVARMRDNMADIALVTQTGELNSPEDVLGVLTWPSVSTGSILPRPLLERKRRVKTV